MIVKMNKSKILWVIEFLLFISYTILIFFIKNYYSLAIVLLVNIVLMLVLKEDIKEAIILILKLMPFILFTTMINVLITGLSFGILIGVRLILVCNVTYIFTKKFTINKLQTTIEILLKPLKIIKIDSKEIGIIVSIGVSFVPIIQKEIQGLKYSLRAKGFKLNIKNMLTKSNYILLPLTTFVIKRIGDIENSLISKGYSN